MWLQITDKLRPFPSDSKVWVNLGQALKITFSENFAMIHLPSGSCVGTNVAAEIDALRRVIRRNCA